MIGLSARQGRAHGQGLVEYALILVLVAVVCIVIVGATGTSVGAVYCNVVKTLNNSAACTGLVGGEAPPPSGPADGTACYREVAGGMGTVFQVMQYSSTTGWDPQALHPIRTYDLPDCSTFGI